MVKKPIKDPHRSVKKTKTLGGDPKKWGKDITVPTKGKDIFKSDSTFGESGKDEVPVQAIGQKGTTLYLRLLDYFLTPGEEWHLNEGDVGWMIEKLKHFSTIGSTDTCGSSRLAWFLGKKAYELNINCKNNKIYSYLLLYNIANYYNIIAPDDGDKKELEKLKQIFLAKLDEHVTKLPEGEKSEAIRSANEFLKTAIEKKIPPNLEKIYKTSFQKDPIYLKVDPRVDVESVSPPQQPSGGKKTRKRRKNRRKTKRVKKYYK